MYAPEYVRDWRMNDPALCDEEFFKTPIFAPELKAKQDTVSNMIKYNLIDEGSSIKISPNDNSSSIKITQII